MRRWLRKLRGVVGTSLTWGVAWALVFAAIGTVAAVVDPGSIDEGEGPLMVALIGFGIGFFSGLTFSALLALTEGRKTLKDLSMGRMAVWGALGGSVMPLLTPANDDMVILCAPIGAAVAAASLVLARRAESRSTEQGLLVAGLPDFASRDERERQCRQG